MIGFESIIYAFVVFISVGLVGQAGSAGYLNGALQRGFAGGTTSIVSANFLLSYTNMESFIVACYTGAIGLTGYIFMLSLGFLAIVWVNNLVEYRQAII